LQDDNPLQARRQYKERKTQTEVASYFIKRPKSSTGHSMVEEGTGQRSVEQNRQKRQGPHAAVVPEEEEEEVKEEADEEDGEVEEEKEKSNLNRQKLFYIYKHSDGCESRLLQTVKNNSYHFSKHY
jgi:hypothetical protein